MIFNGVISKQFKLLLDKFKNYLPLTGGNIDGNVAVSGEFALFSTEATNRVFRSKNANRSILYAVYGEGGFVLYDETNGKQIINSSKVGVNTFNGTLGTKVTGTYTGNGDATERTIVTSGIGKVMVITSNKGSALITSGNGLSIGGSAIEPLSYQDGHVSNNNIVIASTSNFLNADGVTYSYTML